LQRFHGDWIARFPAVCTANSISAFYFGLFWAFRGWRPHKRVLTIDANRCPADAYIFERELAELHPGNERVKENPVNNNTGQEYVSSFRNFRLRSTSTRQAATGIYFCTLTATPITASGQAAGGLLAMTIGAAVI
jgi:hypothetical protein